MSTILKPVSSIPGYQVKGPGISDLSRPPGGKCGPDAP